MAPGGGVDGRGLTNVDVSASARAFSRALANALMYRSDPGDFWPARQRRPVLQRAEWQDCVHTAKAAAQTYAGRRSPGRILERGAHHKAIRRRRWPANTDHWPEMACPVTAQEPYRPQCPRHPEYFDSGSSALQQQSQNR